MDNEEDMFQEHRLAGAGAAGLLTQRGRTGGRISRGEGGSRSMRGGQRSRSRSRVVRGAVVGVRGAVATVAPWTCWLGGRYIQVTGWGWTTHYILHNIHLILHTANCTLHAAYFKLHTAHFKLHTAHC